MGLISRKIFPACESMCVCCPALRSRSRQPVKRYKKLLAEIFPKTPDGPPNERKIAKLCEYAARNPFRIPKIAKYLEERCYKELRCANIKFLNIIAETYSKLLCTCKEHMVYFAVSLLNLVIELLNDSKQDAVRIIGCQLLTRFIYSQVDGTYTYNIEKFVDKVCKLAHETGEEHQKQCLRASSLQCLSAMVWFMEEFSHIFDGIDKIVHASLDNYEHDVRPEDDERGEVHHNWVDEVTRCAGRGNGSEINPLHITRPRPEKKDPSILTREDIESPKVWAQICIQKMVDLAKESTTMRRILDPMFVFFDTKKQWVPRHGLAVIVLSDMSYLASPGNQQLILASVIRHLDHKNVIHDTQMKAHIIQVATALTCQIRCGAVLSDIGFVSDLCRHLRKSLQATVESIGEQELNLNIALQTSIEECLLETAKGIVDAQSLFDMMAMTLEKLPSVKIVARSTIGSLIILAHMISLAHVSSYSQQVFPEELLVQLLKMMLHPDVEIRGGAHHIFSVLLIPNSKHRRHDVFSHTRRYHLNGASTFSSITSLLEKLRREKDGTNEKLECSQDSLKEKENSEDGRKQGWSSKNSPNFHKIKSIIDKTTGSAGSTEAEPSILKLNEDQIAQLLCALWMQANTPDNLPSNLEAIAHSFCLALVSSRIKEPNNSLSVRFFQLALSLMKISFNSNGSLPPAHRRSLLVLSIAMLMFTAKMYQISELSNLLKSLVEFDVDPYVGMSDDFQVYVKPVADSKEYGSAADNQAAASLLLELQNKLSESDKIIMDILAQSLSSTTELEADDLRKQLSEEFTPDDTSMFGLQSTFDMDHSRIITIYRDSPSCDGDLPTSSFVEDDTVSESSVNDISPFNQRMPTSPSPSMSRIVSIGHLLESALEVAGQVAGTSVSSSPLPYNAMASQCESLGTDSRKKLSNWLTQENHFTRGVETVLPSVPLAGLSVSREVKDPWLALRLPPGSPFDNFLKAARF